MADMLNPVDDVFLDENGNPIGQLVMENSTSQAMPDTAVETAGANLAKSKEEELGADLELYPHYEDMDMRQKAKRLFIVESKTVAEISRLTGVPERTVAMWAYNERWDSLVKKELAVRDMQAKLALTKIRVEQRNTVALEQLEQAKAIRERAVEAVKSGAVKGGTDAWAAAAKVEQTILGIKEGGDLASVTGATEEDENKKNEGGKKPLVVIFNGGLPAATRRPL